MAVPFQPADRHTVTPYLIIRGAAEAIEFYQQAFGAQVLSKVDGPAGKIMHAEIKLGDTVVMLADEFPEMGFSAPGDKGSPVSLLLYVPRVDDTFSRALLAGAKTLKPVQDQFYGDRSGTLTDPFGHVWSIATHQEDVSQEELQRRLAAMMQKGK